MSLFTKRIATKGDLPRIIEIYNSTVSSRMVTADLTPVTVEDRKDWFAGHNPSNRPLWVFTTAQNEVAAWLSFENFNQRAAYKKTAELSIYLDEKFRGQGLGSILLREAIEAAPSLHIETLVGRIFGHNTPSLKLFKRFGFEEWGYLPLVAELDGVKRDLVIMGKHIPM
ncbi:GNAT family N-acetyltransferase [Shimazuella sp. AN120528]|uniref:GNAT family N-acetyltransferase n=1 Tax=Shimazuella soli TaxID=1892854 RepID=UPI001F0D5C04|nr:GNAT family N-acetyltransferase [Shimazuella soli]MCH5583651.1 GNAT family N-acetyltransferase [Shimazuella soli]